MDYDTVYKSLLDWISSQKDNGNSAQISFLLVKTGALLAYDCAPDKDEANSVIQNSVKIGWQEHLRAQQEEL